MSPAEAKILIEHAVVRAERKHPGFPDDLIVQAAILAEETGEVVKAALDSRFGETVQRRRRAEEDLVSELLDAAAVIMRMLTHRHVPLNSDVEG